MEAPTLSNVSIKYWTLSEQIYQANFCNVSNLNLSLILGTVLRRERIQTLELRDESLHSSYCSNDIRTKISNEASAAAYKTIWKNGVNRIPYFGYGTFMASYAGQLKV